VYVSKARGKWFQRPNSLTLLLETTVDHQTTGMSSAVGMQQQNPGVWRSCAGGSMAGSYVHAPQERSDANVPCEIDLSPKNLSFMIGGQNCHAEFVSADSVV